MVLEPDDQSARNKGIGNRHERKYSNECGVTPVRKPDRLTKEVIKRSNDHIEQRKCQKNVVAMIWYWLKSIPLLSGILLTRADGGFILYS